MGKAGRGGCVPTGAVYRPTADSAQRSGTGAVGRQQVWEEDTSTYVRGEGRWSLKCVQQKFPKRGAPEIIRILLSPGYMETCTKWGYLL